MPDKIPTVDVIIPVYSEERDLPRSIATLHAFLKENCPYHWRIVIADNASTEVQLSMGLSHLDEAGRARMVDVGGKPDIERVAVARDKIVMQPETLALIQQRGLPKGDVLAVARVAGVMAAKRTQIHRHRVAY